uniref:Transmembrane protein n=2 Tax=Cacopsylla melanoneura TaxID=428564 RepID=A0A8D8THF7_9HEMI
MRLNYLSRMITKRHIIMSNLVSFIYFSFSQELSNLEIFYPTDLKDSLHTVQRHFYSQRISQNKRLNHKMKTYSCFRQLTIKLFVQFLINIFCFLNFTILKGKSYYTNKYLKIINTYLGLLCL